MISGMQRKCSWSISLPRPPASAVAMSKKLAVGLNTFRR